MGRNLIRPDVDRCAVRFRTDMGCGERCKGQAGGGLEKSGGGLELEALHGSFLLGKHKLLLVFVHLWGQIGIFLLDSKIVLN